MSYLEVPPSYKIPFRYGLPKNRRDLGQAEALTSWGSPGDPVTFGYRYTIIGNSWKRRSPIRGIAPGRSISCHTALATMGGTLRKI